MTLPTLNFVALLPQLILIAAALVVLIADLVVAAKRVLGWFSLIAVLAALAVTLFVVPADPAFQTMALADGLGRFAGAAVLIAAALALLLALDRVADFTRRAGAYYALVLLATAGMQALATAADFITIFLAVEILSLALYVLAGFNRRDMRSGEAALKYFLLGAFASAFVPMFNRTIAEDEKEGGKGLPAGIRFAEDVLSVLFPILVVFTAIMMIGAAPIVLAMTGGFPDGGGAPVQRRRGDLQHQGGQAAQADRHHRGARQ